MKRVTFRTYVRELVEDFPSNAMRARREWGWTGLRIAFKAYVSRSSRAIASPVGRLSTHPELLNFLDNFCANELRCPEVEAYLASKESTVVVDLGVNVGVSARWWLTRSPTLRVIGIDMITEALDFAERRISELGFVNRWTPIPSAVGDRSERVRVQISDPLDGTTSVATTNGSECREVQMDTLDRLLQKEDLREIALLKIDIEGYAGFALRGAPETLQKTRHVCVEGHDSRETESCSRILIDSGFVLFKIGGRHMWWRRLVSPSENLAF